MSLWPFQNDRLGNQRSRIQVGFTGHISIPEHTGQADLTFVKTGNFVPALISAIIDVSLVADNYLFISGQLPIDPATGRLVEGDIRYQTRQALQNILAILRAADCRPSARSRQPVAVVGGQ